MVRERRALWTNARLTIFERKRRRNDIWDSSLHTYHERTLNILVWSSAFPSVTLCQCALLSDVKCHAFFFFKLYNTFLLLSLPVPTMADVIMTRQGYCHIGLVPWRHQANLALYLSCHDQFIFCAVWLMLCRWLNFFSWLMEVIMLWCTLCRYDMVIARSDKLHSSVAILLLSVSLWSKCTINFAYNKVRYDQILINNVTCVREISQALNKWSLLTGSVLTHLSNKKKPIPNSNMSSGPRQPQWAQGLLLIAYWDGTQNGWNA